MPTDNEEALALIALLTKTYDLFYKVQMHQAFSLDLTSPQYSVLSLLHKEEKVYFKKLASEISVTGANVTCIVDNLEKLEFVKRTYSTEDRRVIFVSLTTKGKEKIELAAPLVGESIIKASSSLTAKEQKDLIALLSKLI